MTEKVCPNCKSGNLYSHEKATISYPITVGADGSWEYTGDDRIVWDEATEFEDEIWCRECGWEGVLADLADRDK